MGASVYFYFTPYQDNIEAALQALREREFRAGRYDPAMRNVSRFGMMGFSFPPDANSPAPGPIHKSLIDAFSHAALDGSGTRSIIDLFQIEPAPNTCAASPFTQEGLKPLFGTNKPSRVEVTRNIDWESENKAAQAVLSSIERGQGRYAIVYESDVPAEIFFIGYSFD